MNNTLHTKYASSIYSFDGNQWKKIKSIGYGLVSSLAIDKNNSIWIACRLNGLYKIEQDSCVKYTSENSELIYNYVAQVASDEDGNIWLSNYGNMGDLAIADIALMKYDGDKWISFWHGRNLWTHTLTIDGQGNPWFQNPWITKKLDVINKSWSEIITLDVENHILHLHAIEGEDKFWYSKRVNLKDEGIAILNNSDWLFINKANSGLPSNKVYQVKIDAEGTKWFGTEYGLATLTGNSLKTSLEHDFKITLDFDLFPIPANDYLTIKLPWELQHSTVSILNMQGQIIKSFSTNKNLTRMDVSHFPVGVYLVRIQTEGNHILKKFVKQ